MQNKKAVESLEADYVIDDKFIGSDSEVEGEENSENMANLSSEKRAHPVLNSATHPVFNSATHPVSTHPEPPSRQKQLFVGKSKRRKVSFSDLGIEIANESDQQQFPDFTQFLDHLYSSQPKPLYVKTHTKVKVLIVCSSALRCLQVIKHLRQSMPNVMVAKLFARHIKVHEQITLLKSAPFLVGVGTAGRIAKIIETDPDAILVKKVDFLVVDSTYTDKKDMSILDLPETQMDLKKLYSICQDFVQGTYSF